MRQNKNKKRKKASKKQWREYLPVIAHLAAALYWVIRLGLLLWDTVSQ
ncbi:MAG: hypothetical protein IJQ58_10820 [Synergistaceae bacterium]|nr:hypothetical protein [Synergistaceae bacterium]